MQGFSIVGTFLMAVFLFFLPHFFSLQTNQVFAVNKYIFLLVFCSIFAALWGIKMLKTRQIKIISHSLFWVLLATFFFFITLSTLSSSTPTEAFFGNALRHTGMLIFLTLTFLFLYIISAQYTKTQWGIFLGTLCITGLAMATWSILHMLEIYPVFTNFNTEALSNRSFAGVGQPNFLAQAMLIPFFILLAFVARHYTKKNNTGLLHKKSIIMPIAFLCITVFLLGFLGTGSRAASIAIFFGVFIFCSGVFGQYLKRISWLHFGVIFAFVCALVLWVAVFLWGDSIAELLTERGSSIAARHYFWNDSLLLFPQYFFLGVGGDLLNTVLPSVLSSQAFLAENFSTLPGEAHTILLDFILEFGVIPFLVFLYAFVKTIQKGMFEAYHQSNFFALGIVSGLVGLFIMWMFGFFVITDSVIAAVSAGYIWRNASFSSVTNTYSIFAISFVFFLFAFFTAHTAYITRNAEVAFFEMQSSALSAQQKYETFFVDIEKAPFLSSNIISSLPAVPFAVQKQWQQKGGRLGYSSARWNLYNMAFFAALGDVTTSKKYFFEAQKSIGNQFIKQWQHLQYAAGLKIFTAEEYNTQRQYIISLIPQQLRSIPKEERSYAQEKFIKHHTGVLEEILGE